MKRDPREQNWQKIDELMRSFFETYEKYKKSVENGWSNLTPGWENLTATELKKWIRRDYCCTDLVIYTLHDRGVNLDRYNRSKWPLVELAMRQLVTIKFSL